MSAKKLLDIKLLIICHQDFFKILNLSALEWLFESLQFNKPQSVLK